MFIYISVSLKTSNILENKSHVLLIRKCNAIDKMIFNRDNKTLSLKCERNFS